MDRAAIKDLYAFLDFAWRQVAGAAAEAGEAAFATFAHPPVMPPFEPRVESLLHRLDSWSIRTNQNRPNASG